MLAEQQGWRKFEAVVYAHTETKNVSLLSIFVTAILPIVALAGVGWLLGSWREVEAGPLNTITIYVLVPALVFHSLATTELATSTLLSVGVGVLAFSVVMVGLAESVGRGLGESEPILGSLVLVSTFANAANYGIPVSEFAFGTIGRSTAVVYVVAQSILMYTIGVYLAARGNSGNWRTGVKTVFSIPLIYVVCLALLVRAFGIVPPTGGAAMEMVNLVGDSAIPVMLLILGIELGQAKFGTALGLRVAPAVGLKLLAAPVVAVMIVTLIGFQNSTVARVFVLECATPAAVTTLVLTGEFSGTVSTGPSATGFASTTILLTTLLSVPLMTGLIALLQSGVIV